MTTSLEYVRSSCGIAGEEVAGMVDNLEAEVAALEAKLATARKILEDEYKLPDGQYWQKIQGEWCLMQGGECLYEIKGDPHPPKFVTAALAALGDAQPATPSPSIATQIKAAQDDVATWPKSVLDATRMPAFGELRPASVEVKPVAYGVQLLEDGELTWNTVWDEKWAANDHLNSLLSSGLHEGECHVVPFFTHPTPPQQPRQESEIAAVTRERDEFKAEATKHWAMAKDYEEQLAATQAEVEALRKDAIRVKFLRDNTGIDWSWVDRFCFGGGEQLLDATIDAAMKPAADEALEEAETAWAQAHRLALELECFLLSCNDMPTVSKWWDSAHEALEQYRALAAQKREAGE